VRDWRLAHGEDQRDPQAARGGGRGVRGAAVRGGDEPTGNLDSRNSAALMDLLDQLNEAGFTIVVITHDAGVAAHAGRTVAISDGILSERAGVHHA